MTVPPKSDTNIGGGASIELSDGVTAQAVILSDGTEAVSWGGRTACAFKAG